MTCPICLEELEQPTSHTLGCGHSFHASCLLNAVLRGHTACPTRRARCVDDDSDEEEQENGQMETERWQGRGGIVSSAAVSLHLSVILDCVRACAPRMFIIEQASGLLTHHRSLFDGLRSIS